MEENSLKKRRYDATFQIESAIIDAIAKYGNYTPSYAKNLFEEWCTQEEGDIAMTRLINVVIY